MACLQIDIKVKDQKLFILQQMNIETNSYENESPKCKGCKIYFGAEAFQGLCSTCYKKHQGSPKETIEKTKTQKIEQVAGSPKQKKQQDEIKQQKRDRNKCQTCSRKLRNMGIECKCGLVFCTMHRLPEDHECTFDHMKNGIKKLQKDLIKVANGKIEKMD